jgi:hypothetical protein
MKNAPNLELGLLARQWGATTVPFGELAADGWLDTPEGKRAQSLLQQTASLRSVMLLAGPNGVGKSALVGKAAIAMVDVMRSRLAVMLFLAFNATDLVVILFDGSVLLRRQTGLGPAHPDNG